MGYDSADFRDMRASINHVDRLLKSFLRRQQAGALVELSYANPRPYSELVKASHSGLTDYFLCRADFEGPALKQMGDRIAAEINTPARKRKEFASNAASITGAPEIRSAFEIGPGDGQKILEFMKSDLGSSVNNISFIDKQAEFTDNAARGIKEIDNKIHITQISQDIFSESGRHKFGSKVLGMVLGGTISNVTIDGYPNEKTEYPHEQFVEMFRILSAYYSKDEGGSLLVSADTSDLQTMINAYRDRAGTSYNADFSMNSLDLIQQSYKEAYDMAPPEEKDRYKLTIKSSSPYLDPNEELSFRDLFRAETKYFSKSQLAAHCLVCDYPASVTIGKNSKPIELGAGWYNATIISAKPRIDQLVAAARETNKFNFVDKTSNEEPVNQGNSKEFRRVDVLRFDFENSARNAVNSQIPSAPKPEKMGSTLSVIREALMSTRAAGAFFMPAPTAVFNKP